jgi:dinuclear metal center YbgI/SA1388 family protein
MKIKEIYDFLNEIAPFETAAQWDNTGLCVGSLGKEVDKVILSLDVTTDVINKAEQTGAQLVLTHHPLIFDGIKNIEEDSLVYTAVKSGITFLSSHTCLDKATGGVNDCLANAVGIKNLCCSEIDEFLKIGDIEPSSAEDFANKIKLLVGNSSLREQLQEGILKTVEGLKNKDDFESAIKIFIHDINLE